MKIIGIDPGLRHTGWGVIETEGSRTSHIAHGRICPQTTAPFSARLYALYTELRDILAFYSPHEAAIEKVFVNNNPASTLQLGMARGVLLIAPQSHSIPCFEYEPNKIKKSVIGQGHADKTQVEKMVRLLLPGCDATKDSADALAIAICHAHHRTFENKINSISQSCP